MRDKLAACLGLIFFTLCYLTVIECRLENRIVHSKSAEFELGREGLVDTSRGDLNLIHRKRREVLSVPDINVDVQENATVGSIVYSFNNTQTYRYVMKNYNPRFEVINNTVAVKEQLDYETSPEETVTVVYWNSYEPSTSVEVNIVITVQDVNEPPKWTMEYEPYLAVTTLNVVNEVRIYTLSAEDPEDPNAEIEYGLFIDESNMFDVDPSTGYVYIDKQSGSSFEEDKEYTLTVTAYEKNDSSMRNYADVRVKVGERPPQFTREVYTVTISEDTSVPVTLITVKAKSFEHSETVTYTIEEQPTGTNHVINENGVITLNTELDRERFSSYTLRIKAADTKGESICEVHVTDVLDENDNAPVFSQFVYAFRNIPEDIDLDTSVGRVVVSDEDGDFYGSVLLSIPSGEPFRIDGDGYIFPTSELDYESNPMYDFTVTAVDLGDQSSTASVHVDLLNVNDVSPEFSQSNYTFDVDDTVTAGYKISTVYAADPDGDLVTFAIKSCSQCEFDIDAYTGVISRSSVSGNLDKASYSLTVEASDDGSCCSPLVTNSAETTVTIRINDINDNTPDFPECDTYSPSIAEGMPRLSSVLIVTATDSDPGVNGQVTFSLKENDFRNGYFDIETLGSGQGLLKTLRTFDREIDETFALTLLAEDNAVSYGLTGFCQITVTVTDVNDEYPVLADSSVTIQRSLSVGSDVIKIEAFDPDLIDIKNGLTYTLDGTSAEFELDSDGTLKVKASLDSAPQNIELTVKATDNANQEATADVDITVIDGQAGAPVFTPQPAVNLLEDVEVGDPVFTVTATSSDLNNPAVTYIIIIGNTPETNNPRKFQIDSNTGVVTVFGILDYEEVQSYELLIQATDANSELSEYMSVTVNINDTNDQVPEFDLARYVANLEEGDYTGQDILVVTVHAQDADTVSAYQRVVYGQDPTKYEPLFEVDQSTGEIRTSGMFDREKTSFYQLTIIAEDAAPSAITDDGDPNKASIVVTVQIIDENDNDPTFDAVEYTADVIENASIDFSITLVTAVDKDEDSVLNYLIAGGTTYPSGTPYQNAVFEVDSETGSVMVAASLDFETVQRYELDYIVTDGLHENSTRLIINVQDANDNAPVFSENGYTATVTEVVDGGSWTPDDILTVTATDADADSGIIRYFLSGHDSNFFTIDSLSGVIQLLQYLDYEYKPEWHFIVEARDEDGTGLTGETDVIIMVNDINDHPPEFNQAEYEGDIAEGSGIRYVMTVSATDADSPAHSKNVYSLEPIAQSDLPTDGDDGLTIFSIDSDDGKISTQAVTLDRESIDKYYVLVKAEDPSTLVSATATATIIVTDVNDNPPVFDPDVYSESVPESLTLDDKVLEIFATDADTGVYAELEFTFVSGNEDSKFEIIRNPANKQNAVIYLINELDYETKDEYNLVIRASDQEASDTATATITVTNVNEAPVFGSETYSKTVPEGAPTSPFLTVSATDEDGNSISYEIDPATNEGNWLNIDENTGVITQVGEFDREAISLHNFIVWAKDNGSPSATGSCTLSITVTDINDECPRLVEDYKPKIMENQAPPQLVQIITALDPDEGDQTPYTFSIVNGNDNGGQYTVNDAFSLTTISDTSAEIETRKELDRESQKFYDMEIKTEDSTGISCTSTVTIEIGDENDNPHQAGKKSMSVYTYEGGTSTGVGTTPIGPVNSPDLDDDDLDEKTFTKVAPDDWVYFDLDTDTGIILIKEGTPDGIYEMKILVSDDVHPDQTSTVTVTVTDLPEEAVYNSGSIRMSGDSNFNAAEFVREPDSTYSTLRTTLAEILETQEANVDIFSVMDVDGESNVIDVRYSAHGSPYYKAERLDMAVRANEQKVQEATGLTLVMIKIDACYLDEGVCESSCYNNYTVTKDPYLIDLESQSFTGITTYTTAACGCAGREVFPDGCSYDACMNGGTCTPTTEGFSCTCPTGYEGGRCEMTKRSFEGEDSYAWVETLEQCEDTVTSIEFITAELDGTLFYNGPMQTLNVNPSDFILLELVDGRPKLQLNLGDDTAILSFSSNDLGPLNDNKWHTVEIRRNAQYVEVVVDHCRSAIVVESGGTSTIDATSCMVTGTVAGNSKLLNLNTPLQIGGVDTKSPWVYGFTTTGFNGCVRNLIQDGKLYDLSDSNTGTSFQNSQQGCPRTDDNCIDNTDGTTCVNGICDADTNTGVCICYPGYTGDKCDQETPPYDFTLNSFVDYTVKTASGLDTTGYEEHYHSMVRTWEETGLVWYIANLDTGEHTTIEIVDGTMQLRYNHGEGEHSMNLPNYRVNNGAWHSVEFDRYGNYVTLKVDRGGGTRQTEGSPGTFQHFIASPETLRVGDSLGNEVIPQDFQGCMNDPRINNNYLGFSTSTYADVTLLNNVTEGCISEACNGVTCPPPTTTCNDLWRKYECICPANTVGESCTPVLCASNPCKHGGKCFEDADGYTCTCAEGYTGDTCNIGKEVDDGNDGLSAAVIAVICICLLILLVLLILMLLYKNNNLRRKKAILDYENEDLSENLAYYDEEGGGEEDHDGYDINTLSKPLDRVSGESHDKSRLIPESAVPVSKANPDETVTVANMLDDRLPKVDGNPDHSPYDSLHLYDYEGDGSTAGSLSSINSSSSDSSQNFEYLDSWGQPFKRLADMYGGGQDED